MSNLPKRCYMSHPPLVIGDYKIYGGSCIDPIVTDADIYVGFDYGMAKSHKAYPWEEGESFLFPIQDMGVPKDPEQFKKLVDWIAVQLIAKKKIHLGCIGGHGRTGMVLAALVKVMLGEKDAIQYVRKHYCTKAVESAAQVTFLRTHFEVSTAKGHKEFDHDEAKYHRGTMPIDWGNRKSGKAKSDSSANYSDSPSLKSSKVKYAPTQIWGSTVVLTN